MKSLCLIWQYIVFQHYSKNRTMDDKKKDQKILQKIFLTSFFISAFTFGGGYVIVPLMKKKFSDELKWIDEPEMLDLVAIAQSAPGPIAVNASILVGYKIAKFWGTVASVLGTVLPPLITISVISFFYLIFKENTYAQLLLKGLQIGAAAVIADAVFSICSSSAKKDPIFSIIMMLLAFIASFILKINVIWIIPTAGIVGFLYDFFRKKNNKKKE